MKKNTVARRQSGRSQLIVERDGLGRKKKNFTLIKVSARSLLNKTAELEHFIMLYQPDVLAVTETWLRPEIADSEIMPPTYRMIRNDRDSHGGGVALIFKEEIEFVPIKECPNTESIWCKIKLGVSSCVIAAVYRPPNALLAFLKSLQDYILSNASANAKVIIAGDFNLPNILWESLEV